MSPFLDFILNKIPASVWFVAGGLAVWLYFSLKNKIDKTKEKVDRLPCDRHEKRLENLKCTSHESDTSSIKTTLKKIETSAEILKDEWLKFDSKGIANSIETLKVMNHKVCRWIMKNDTGMIDELDFYAQKQSPTTLTNAGEELLEKSSAKETMDNNLNFFIEKLKEYNPKTPYDVEDMALDVVLLNTGNEIFNDIKKFLYYSPEEIEFSNGTKAKISLQAVIKVMSVYLRDRYFEKYPDIQKV